MSTKTIKKRPSNEYDEIPLLYADAFSGIYSSPSVTKIEFCNIDMDGGDEIKTPTFRIVLSTDTLFELSKKFLSILEDNKEDFRAGFIEMQERMSIIDSKKK